MMRSSAFDLTPFQRALWGLYKESRMNQSQLARALGLNIASVNTHIQIAREKIKAAKDLEDILDHTGVSSLSRAHGRVHMSGTK